MVERNKENQLNFLYFVQMKGTGTKFYNSWKQKQICKEVPELFISFFTLRRNKDIYMHFSLFFLSGSNINQPFLGSKTDCRNKNKNIKISIKFFHIVGMGTKICIKK